MTSPFRLLLSSFTASLFLSFPRNGWGAENIFGETGDYFRMLWGLLIVLGIILLLYGVLKKRLSLFSSSTTQSIKILEIKPLMGKKALCIVEVKGKEYLLGIGNDQISHLATISQKKDSAFAKTLEETTPKIK